jgi:hypothetical protein
MRPNGRIVALASAFALAASSTPAYAFEAGPASGPSKSAPPVATVHHSGSSGLVLGLAAGGGIALLGTGLAASRQRCGPARSDAHPTPLAAPEPIESKGPVSHGF